MKKKDRQTVNFIKEKAEELFYENLGPDGEIAENIRQIYIEFGSETKNFKEADIWNFEGGKFQLQQGNRKN